MKEIRLFICLFGIMFLSMIGAFVGMFIGAIIIPLKVSQGRLGISDIKSLLSMDPDNLDHI